MAQVAVCSQINTKHINTMWAERTVVECQTAGASRDQQAAKRLNIISYLAIGIKEKIVR